MISRVDLFYLFWLRVTIVETHTLNLDVCFIMFQSNLCVIIRKFLLTNLHKKTVFIFLCKNKEYKNEMFSR